MINIIVELSKYLMIALMLVYTFECFAVFNYTDEYTQRSIFRKQNVLMFLLHMIAFLVMYLQTNETKNDRILRDAGGTVFGGHFAVYNNLPAGVAAGCK